MQLRCSKDCNLYIILKTNYIACISLRTKKKGGGEENHISTVCSLQFLWGNPKKILSTTSHVSSLKRHCTFRLFVNVITFPHFYISQDTSLCDKYIYAGSFSFTLRLLTVDVTRTSNSYNPTPSQPNYLQKEANQFSCLSQS